MSASSNKKPPGKRDSVVNTEHECDTCYYGDTEGCGHPKANTEPFWDNVWDEPSEGCIWWVRSTIVRGKCKAVAF